MRDLLVALCGLTPQVITETLWALNQQRPSVIPDKIFIVTTQSGSKACERLLFGKRGKLYSYQREYRSTQSIRCGPRNVIILRGSDGNPVEDLRTQRDNLAVADQLAAFIRDLTAIPNTRLHCSVAGGRKTMGVILAAVLQVYGRPEDRLYHVLVSPEFESQPEFFYIPKRPRLLAIRNRKFLDTVNARIELAEIPYVRLRAYLPNDLLKQALSFTELVARAQKHLRALERLESVRIDISSGRLLIGETEVKFSPAQFRLYTAFARIKTEKCVEPARTSCDDCTKCYAAVTKANWDAVREQLENIAGDRFLWAADSQDPGIAPARFRTLISKTNQALVKGFKSKQLAERYHIRSDGLRGETCYGLAVDKTLLRVES